MKNFKSYLTEVSGDGNRKDQDPAKEAHRNIANILSDLRTKSDILNPSRVGEGIGLHSPYYDIMEGGKVIDGHSFGGKFNRRYRWKTWNDGLDALSSARMAQYHAVGYLTGNHKGRDMSLEEFESARDTVHSRFANIINSFKDQHQSFIEDISIFHPEIKRNLDVLHRMGHSIQQVNDVQFRHALEQKSYKQQNELVNRFDGRTGEIHDELQDFFTKENNRAVTVHNHPLGLMFSGGIRSLSGNSSSKPVVEERHPTDLYKMVDISHKYEH